MRLADHRDVALDHAILFERANPPQTRGLGEIDQFGEVFITDAAVALQGVEDQLVVSIENHGRLLL